jgi:MFS family permease
MPVSRNIRLLSWFNFWGDFRPYAPIAILYFSQVSGSYALGMSVYSIAMLAQSAFEVPTGIFSDMIGRKKTVVYGAIAGVLSLICYAIGGTYLALVIGGIFEGLGRSFYSGNNDALLYDTLAEMGQREAFNEYLGKTLSMLQTALAISAVVGSVIAAISFQVAMWVSVLPMVLALFISFRMVEPRAFTRETTNVYAHLLEAFRQFRRNARLRTLSLANILNFAIGESAWLFRSTFVASLWPVWALGIAQMIGNAGAAISFYYAGRLIRRFGEYRLIVFGMSFSPTVDLFGLLFPTVLSPLLMSLSPFYGVNTVARNGLLQREFTDAQRATMGSFNSFGGSIVFSIFSFLLGALADRIGVIPALITAVAVSIVPTVMYWKVLRPRNAETVTVSEAEGVI